MLLIWLQYILNTFLHFCFMYVNGVDMMLILKVISIYTVTSSDIYDKVKSTPLRNYRFQNTIIYHSTVTLDIRY